MQMVSSNHQSVSSRCRPRPQQVAPKCNAKKCYQHFFIFFAPHNFPIINGISICLICFFDANGIASNHRSVSLFLSEPDQARDAWPFRLWIKTICEIVILTRCPTTSHPKEEYMQVCSFFLFLH